MALPVTSGQVQQSPWDVRKVTEHAFRRAGLAAEMVAAENIQIANECIIAILNTWVSIGFPLWTREYFMLSPQIGSPDVPTPYGTVDVHTAFWRQFAPWRGQATTTDGQDATALCAGSPTIPLTIAGPNPGVFGNFSSPTEVDQIGILQGGSSVLTLALQVQISPDGTNWTTVQTLPSATFTPGMWTYLECNPAVTAPFVRVINPTPGSWTVNNVLFGLSGWFDVKIGPLNIDDYYNLPNRWQQGQQAVSAFVDRQINAPVIKIWDTLNVNGFYNGTVTALVRRYIQDPGAMFNLIEIPQRGIEALTWRLASSLLDEIQDSTNSQQSFITVQVKQAKAQRIEQRAAKEEALFWSEERNRSPINIAPDISPYTR